MAKQPLISVVVPVYNECESVRAMAEAVDTALVGFDYELIFVDDGSRDGTPEIILGLPFPKVRLLVFARNFGQTSALAAGIEAAQGEYIALLDGDLQNDPADIPMMLEKLQAEKLDMVAGRRAKRQDGMLLRKIPSKIANRLIRKVSKVQISDYGCTLKVFKAGIAKNLDLYGELHRFIPILADMRGAKIAEVDVRHHARRYGVSKYGIGRTLKVMSDLLLMAFFIRYRSKPMHLFGTLGLSLTAIGSVIELYLLLLKIAGNDIGQRPLFFVGILLLLAGLQLITTGFIAELLMRTYHRAGNSTPYTIARRYAAGKELVAKEGAGE